MWFEQIRNQLMNDDEEFRKIAKEHKKYDEMLKELSQRKYLSPDDQMHKVELKKKKLVLKDKMLQIATEYKQSKKSS